MKPADKEFKLNMGSFFLKGLIFLLLVVISRIVDFLIGSSPFSWNSVGLWQDFIAASTWLIFISPLYILTVRYFKRLANIILSIWLTLGFAFQILLIIYFSIADTALRAEHMYGMSETQVDSLLQLYGFSWFYLLLLIPLALGIDVLLKQSKKLQSKKWIEFIAASLIVFGSLLNIFWPIQEADFDSDLEFETKANKTQLFLKSYFNYEGSELSISDVELETALQNYYRINKIVKDDYFDYPFFSPELSKNHLGSYFVAADSTPNVVIIIAESLSKVFSGPNARLGSFTPFLDSLQAHSLYFENCLANAERTFGAIPNIIAGVPEGDKGFLNLRSAMPDHLSLPLLLKENEGYQTNFFCGARKDYDFMDEYLMFQKFDNIYGEHDFKRNEIMGDLEFEEGDVRDFNWGAEDLKVFEESMDFLESKKKDKPFFNLYLTTSFHEPYAYSNQFKFLKLAEKAIDQNDNPKKNELRTEKETIAALMYMDDAIRNCIENYKQRADFNNTIFVIVGDHGTKFLSENSRIEKYHVPLLIFSPLLKEPQHFENVMCQKDIPSALQALLRDNFNLNLPDFSISQSNNILDSPNASFPLMYADKRLENFCHKGEFLVGEKSYRLNSKMRLDPSAAGKKEFDDLKELLKVYGLLSIYACYENKYIPVEQFDKWAKRETAFYLDDNFEKSGSGGLPSCVYKSSITQKDFFSDSASISNLSQPYLGILKDCKIKSNERVRLKMSFKIKSTKGDLPVIYITESIQGQADLASPIHLSANEGFLRETKKGDWQEFSFTFWLNKGEKEVGEDLVSIHLHMADESTFFMDDLQIELREF